MEQKFEIVNKVHYQQKNKNKTSVLRNIAIVLCLIVIAGSLLMGKGLAGVSVGVIAILFANLSGNMSDKRGSDAYKTVFAELMVTQTHLSLVNKEVDKEDGFGLRNETYSFGWDKVSAIYFSQELMSVCVEGKGTLTMTWTSEKRKGRPDKTVDVNRCYIYFKEEQKDEIIREVEAASGYRVQMMA